MRSPSSIHRIGYPRALSSAGQGEPGPEAIVPLNRGADGNLSVAAREGVSKNAWIRSHRLGHRPFRRCPDSHSGEYRVDCELIELSRPRFNNSFFQERKHAVALLAGRVLSTGSQHISADPADARSGIDRHGRRQHAPAAAYNVGTITQTIWMSMAGTRLSSTE